MYEGGIELRMRGLPEGLKREVLDYMEFLLKKYQIKEIKATRFNFNWEGGLSDLRNKFTSIELQHKALEWR